MSRLLLATSMLAAVGGLGACMILADLSPEDTAPAAPVAPVFEASAWPAPGADSLDLPPPRPAEWVIFVQGRPATARVATGATAGVAAYAYAECAGLPDCRLVVVDGRGTARVVEVELTDGEAVVRLARGVAR